MDRREPVREVRRRVHREARLGEPRDRAEQFGRRAAEQLGAQHHRAHVGLRVVVGVDRAADVARAAGRPQVAGRGEDRVGRVVRVLVTVAVGVDSVRAPGGRQELHPALGAGARDAEVAPVVGLDLVDRRQHLPGDAVGRAGRLEDRQQERGDLEVFDEEVGHTADDRPGSASGSDGVSVPGASALCLARHLADAAAARAARFGFGGADGRAGVQAAGRVLGVCLADLRGRFGDRRRRRFRRRLRGRRFSGARGFPGRFRGGRRHRRRSRRRGRRFAFGRERRGGGQHRERAERRSEQAQCRFGRAHRSVPQQVVEEHPVGFRAFRGWRVVGRARGRAADRLRGRLTAA